ncbi:MAG TPA: hypothetical protein VGM56_25180 [Byssovorax sp.]|jgi:hypothetical protein
MTDTDTIEDFAHLLAELESPFALRRAVLAEHGLSEVELAALTERWSRDLMRDGGRENSELARRFNVAYLSMASALSTAAQQAIPAVDVRFLNADVQPFRGEAAHVPLHAPDATPPALAQPGPVAPDTEKLVPAPGAEPLDMTLELSEVPPEMRLPFRAPEPGAPTAAPPDDDTDLDATLPLAGPTAKKVLRGTAALPTTEGLPHVSKAALPFGPKNDDRKPKT